MKQLLLKLDYSTNNLQHNNQSVKYNLIGQLNGNKAQIDNEKIDSHIRYSLPTEKIIVIVSQIMFLYYILYEFRFLAIHMIQVIYILFFFNYHDLVVIYDFK